MDKQSNIDGITDLVIAQAITALIYASSWPKTRKVLEGTTKHLAIRSSTGVAQFYGYESYLQGDIEDCQKFGTVWKKLLARARIFGVALAWQNFSPL